MQLIKYLIADHKTIRELLHAILSASDTDERKSLFNDLSKIVISHTKAEESSIYDKCRNVYDETLIALANEGMQEHLITLELLDKIKRTHNEDLWHAKVKVLSELLNHHLDEEEEHMFPKFKTNFTKDELDHAADKYIKIRQINILPTDFTEPINI